MEQKTMVNDDAFPGGSGGVLSLKECKTVPVSDLLMKKGDEVYTSNELRDVRLVRIDSGEGAPVLLVYGQAPDGGKLNGVLYTSEIYKESERGRKLRAGPKYKRVWGESLEAPERSGPTSPNTSLLGRYLRE